MKSSMDIPKFYTNDILSILKERDELKVRVLELEEEILELKKEVSRLSNFGTLTLSPNIQPLRRARAEAILLVDSVNRQHPVSAAFIEKPLKCYRDLEQYISDVEVTGYEKKGHNYVYVIKLTWPDGQRFEIYRRYGEFFTFQNTLTQLFPEQSGKKKSAVRIIPSLPTIDNVLSLFGRTNTESVIKARLSTINEYCQIILLHLDAQVSRSPHVLNFFKPTIGDTQLSKLRRNEDMDFSILSVYPQNVPAGSSFEEYIVIADYEGTTKVELKVSAGDRVKVIKKEKSGWWLAVKESGNQWNESHNEETGYISSEYLKPYDLWKSSSGEDVRVDMDATELKYVAIEDYETDDPRQLSFIKEEVVLVIEKSEDGWWLIARGEEQGWAPGSYLKPFNETHDEEDASKDLIVEEEKGENYMAIAGYYGEEDEDVSFPEGATVEVLEKSITGWWLVRYRERMGVAPASLLALPPTPISSSLAAGESKDMGHCISGIKAPPPRSKRFIRLSQRKMSRLAVRAFKGKESSFSSNFSIAKHGSGNGVSIH